MFQWQMKCRAALRYRCLERVREVTGYAAGGYTVQISSCVAAGAGGVARSYLAAAFARISSPVSLSRSLLTEPQKRPSLAPTLGSLARPCLPLAQLA